MIYAVYPIMLLTLLWGCRLSKKGEYNEEVFSLRQMKAMQGFAALCIMLHHCGQKTSASWINKKYFVPGLEFFVPIGFVLVTFFTFSSGYGLYKSYKLKKDYVKDHFISKRIVPMIVLGYVVSCIFFVVRVGLGEKMDGMKPVWYLTQIKLCNPNGWYVLIMPIFYFAFYLAFRFCKKENMAILMVLLFTIGYQVLGASLDHNDWWLRGEWWYNSIHGMIIGIFVAKYEEIILRHIKKHYIMYLCYAIVAVAIFAVYRGVVDVKFSYYGENFHAQDKVFRRLVCLSGDILYSTSIVFSAYLIGLKLRIGNRILDLCGKVTLEFYLIHGVFVELFCYSFDGKLKSLYYIKDSALFVVVVFVLAIPATFVVKKIKEVICAVIRRMTGQSKAA